MLKRYLAIPFLLVVLFACQPPSQPGYPTETRLPAPTIHPIPGKDILASPDGAKKAVYAAYASPTLQVVDQNGDVLWSISYDPTRFGENFRPPEPWLLPFYWSKNSRYLYYTCFHGQETDGSSKFYGNELIDGCGVFQVDTETGTKAEILPEIAPLHGYYAFAMAPDEQHLVYTYQNETPVQIKLLNMKTKAERVLFTASAETLETGNYGWHTDGNRLAFTTLKITGDEKRLYSIYTLDLQSLETQTVIENFDTRLVFVRWDSNNILTYRIHPYGELWQIQAGWTDFRQATLTPSSPAP